jgi:hypothetical protein
MGNIQLMKTSEPSDLLLCIKSYVENEGSYAENSDTIGNFRIGVGKYANKSFYNNQQMYITDNSEIKEGDWCYNSITNKIYIKLKGNVAFAYEYKIILTTDQYLIKDGVQVIDNKFLQWFINNSSCRNVDIEKEKITLGDVAGTNYIDFKYNIVIPKDYKVFEVETRVSEVEYSEDLSKLIKEFNLLNDKLNDYISNNPQQFYKELEAYNKKNKTHYEKTISSFNNKR